MDSRLDVSVIVPTRSRSSLLAQTLRSVLWQRHVTLEAIVVDDASTDDTIDVVRAFGDPRVRIIQHDAPRGVAAARNRGAETAQGEWLAFVDDDDLWAPDKLARQLEAGRVLDRDWIYGGAVVIDADTRIRRAQYPLSPEMTVEQLERCDVIPGGASNVVLHRSTWNRVGGFDDRFAVLADWELYLRLANNSLPACVQRPLVARRIHRANLSLDVAAIEREIRLIEAKHHISADWGRMRRWMAHSCLRSGCRRTAIHQFIVAAGSGQFWGVTADMWCMLRGIANRMLRAGASQPVARDRWTSAVEVWLCQLREQPVECRESPTQVSTSVRRYSTVMHTLRPGAARSRPN